MVVARHPGAVVNDGVKVGLAAAGRVDEVHELPPGRHVDIPLGVGDHAERLEKPVGEAAPLGRLRIAHPNVAPAGHRDKASRRGERDPRHLRTIWRGSSTFSVRYALEAAAGFRSKSCTTTAPAATTRRYWAPETCPDSFQAHRPRRHLELKLPRSPRKRQ